MLYRKTSPRPLRSLLRVAAGATALATAAACSSSSTSAGSIADGGDQDSPACGALGSCVVDGDSGFSGVLDGGSVGSLDGAVGTDAGVVGLAPNEAGLMGAVDGGVGATDGSIADGPVGVAPLDAGSDH